MFQQLFSASDHGVHKESEYLWHDPSNWEMLSQNQNIFQLMKPLFFRNLLTENTNSAFLAVLSYADFKPKAPIPPSRKTQIYGKLFWFFSGNIPEYRIFLLFLG